MKDRDTRLASELDTDDEGEEGEVVVKPVKRKNIPNSSSDHPMMTRSKSRRMN